VPAARVKNLFMAPVVPPVEELQPVAEEPESEPAEGTESAESAFFTPAEPAKETKKPPAPADRPKRVVRIKGGVLLSQDGRYVSFAKQCDVCGHKDSTRSSSLIRVGTTRIPYFCRKCRKGRVVEIQGVT